MARVAAPGATIVLVTWCHRDLSPDEETLRPDEKKLLNKISNAHLLPAWCSAADYANFAESLKLEVNYQITDSLEGKISKFCNTSIITHPNKIGFVIGYIRDMDTSNIRVIIASRAARYIWYQSQSSARSVRRVSAEPGSR